MALVLGLAVLGSSCKEYPLLVKEGPLFAAPENKLPVNARVYIYWPREEQGQRNHLWVGLCENANHEILPGGYTELVVEPGPNCFSAEANLALMNSSRSSASLSQSLGNIKLNTEPGRTFFIRLEQERLLLISRTVLRQIEPGVAGPEISRCRQSIPMTGDEMFQQYAEENGN